jgi:hypothetical protein
MQPWRFYGQLPEREDCAEEMYKVIILITSWNHLNYTLSCLESLKRCTPGTESYKYDFVIIDDCSTDDGLADALASIEVIEEECLLENALRLEDYFIKRMEKMKREHKIIGDVRAKGCLLGIEMVRDQQSKEPFDEAGKMVYAKAFRKGLAWVPAGHILRLSPSIIMDKEVAAKGMDIVEEAIYETEKELGY